MSILSLAKKAVLEECKNTEYMTPYRVLCKRVEKIDPNCPYYDEVIDDILRELLNEWRERLYWEEYVDALEWALNGGRQYEYI